MKLIVKDGKVAYLYKAGKDLVSGKLEASVAQAIVDGSKNTVVCKDHPEFPPHVDEKWYFPIMKEPSAEPTKKGKKTSKSKE